MTGFILLDMDFLINGTVEHYKSYRFSVFLSSVDRTTKNSNKKNKKIHEMTQTNNNTKM